MADDVLDLLGDPIPDGWGEPGRPPHVATDQKRQKVVLLLALDKPISDVATALGITAKTLRKHYSPELRARAAARLRLEGALLGALASEAAAGSVAANKEIDKRLQRHDLRALGPQAFKSAKAAKLGKKEQRLADAKASAPNSSWGDLVNPQGSA